jgi:hypothetical protein
MAPVTLVPKQTLINTGIAWRHVLQTLKRRKA